MSWFCKKPPVPVMDVITPRFKHTGGVFYFGLDKRNNTIYACVAKPPPLDKYDLKPEDLNQIVSISTIRSIYKMKSGGVVVSWTNGRISIYEPLEKGEVLVSNLDSREVLPRYDGNCLFPLQGHAEFDLLECLFKSI